MPFLTPSLIFLPLLPSPLSIFLIGSARDSIYFGILREGDDDPSLRAVHMCVYTCILLLERRHWTTQAKCMIILYNRKYIAYSVSPAKIALSTSDKTRTGMYLRWLRTVLGPKQRKKNTTMEISLSKKPLFRDSMKSAAITSRVWLLSFVVLRCIQGFSAKRERSWIRCRIDTEEYTEKWFILSLLNYRW